MFSMTCFVCIIMWIRVHFYVVHVVSLNTHDIAHVIIQPLEIYTFNNRLLRDGYALFKCFSLYLVSLHLQISSM